LKHLTSCVSNACNLELVPDPGTSNDMSPGRVLVRGRHTTVQLMSGDDDRRPTPTDSRLTATAVQWREVSCTSA